MKEGYFKTKDGLHVFHDSATGLQVVIDNALNTGTVYYESENQGDTKPLTNEDAVMLIQFMRIPGSGLGMLMIKLLRAFSRAVGSGSDAS
jgi:hypothetical protein